MSKLKDHLTERDSPNSIANELEGTIEDILFQLEIIAEMDAVGFNIKKKIRRSVSDLRKLGNEIIKDVKGSKV